jgi:hypothetical protein
MKGRDYAGFMKEKDGDGLGDGELLGVTFDCFAYHRQVDLDYVAFVKVDVEGFESAVLKGRRIVFLGKGRRMLVRC